MPKTTDRLERIRKNREAVDRADYLYIFTPSSMIFHRKECLRGLSASTIQGCIYYRTAEKKRRPCKVCKPEPEDREGSKNYGKPEQCQQNTIAGVSTDTRPDGNELIRVRLLNGRIELIKRKNILGGCHNLIHPGKLTKKLMESHGCISKQCPFFKKNEEIAYWDELERRQVEKAEVKKKRKEEAREEAKKRAGLEELKVRFQDCFDRLEYLVRVIRVEVVKPNVFRIFYVSDHKFPDGSLYSDFYETVQKQNPPCRVLLRHIRDMDGHYVTREEYTQRFG